MASYRVSFINDIPRGGQLFHCCQRSIIIRAARGPERAVEAAKRRFAKCEGMRNWKIHAERIEVELIDLPAKPSASSQSAGGRERL